VVAVLVTVEGAGVTVVVAVTVDGGRVMV
jgi:hypothetical protein